VFAVALLAAFQRDSSSSIRRDLACSVIVLVTETELRSALNSKAYFYEEFENPLLKLWTF